MVCNQSPIEGTNVFLLLWGTMSWNIRITETASDIVKW